MKNFLVNYGIAIKLVILIFIILVGCAGMKIRSMTYEPLPTVIPTATPTYQWVPPLPTPTFTPTETPLPDIQYPLGEPVSFIPEPFYYSCRMTPDMYCIGDYTEPSLAVAMTISDEGGSIDLQMAVDMLEVLDNTMRNAWDCWKLTTGCSEKWTGLNPYHLEYSETSIEIRQALAMFIMSSPYNSNGHIPAWNAWAVPFPKAYVESLSFTRRQFDVIHLMVLEWFESNTVGIDQTWPDAVTMTTDYYKLWPAEILATDQSIMYFYGGFKTYDERLAKASQYTYVFKVQGVKHYIYYSSKFLYP